MTERKIIEYKLIHLKNEKAFRESISFHLSKNYFAYGIPFIYENDFYQVWVKYEERNNKNRKIIDYVVLTAEENYELRKKVLDAIKAGFVIRGDAKYGDNKYFQTMIKYEEKK